ncbi:RPA-interacting protein B-like [Mytilus edulis]|uniref:RPA-interacting protein B-like n=1 Tax=Mytilus edulis TaxID=6550 RepID=UPI0039EE76BF
MSGSEKTKKNHRDMYKAKTPPWKETYRKRCLDRLRQSRSKFQDRFRGINSKEMEKDANDNFIHELMREELKIIQRSFQGSPTFDDIEMETDKLDFDVDEYVTYFDDIQQELIQEEKRMIDEYENSLQQEEKSLCTAIERLCTDEVICPVCQKSQLLQNKGIIFCRCGLRIDTEQDCITLANVKSSLEEGINQHGTTCEGEAVFSSVQDYGSNNLLMSCKTCDWMYIVI